VEKIFTNVYRHQAARLVRCWTLPRAFDRWKGSTRGVGVMTPGRCVLIAEDDAVIRRLLKINLDRGGFSVVEARDGDEALALAARWQPAALVTDLRMPHRDGRELVFALRLQPAFTNLPVLILTANPDDAALDDLRSLARVEVMGKPPKWSSVVGAVRHALGCTIA
jgi:CheY-like chemotaxis protein